jgi:AcrR family transcriptional regulator
MMQEHTDLRVRRTQKMLQEALIDLIAERGFDSITVGDIAERAMVNRATFYRHYQDKYDLLQKIFEGALRKMMEDIGPPRLPNRIDFDNPSPRWVGFFNHFAQNAKLYEAMLGRRGDPWFAARMRDYMAGVLMEREKERLETLGSIEPALSETLPLDVLAIFTANALLGMITWWLENGRPYTAEQMSAWLIKLLVNGYLKVLYGMMNQPEHDR